MTGARVAILPARGGSKRIPRKNVRPFHGRPMLAWPIAAAQACNRFHRIVVSTDDPEIAEIARAHGAETPFLRPANLSDDHATTLAVMQHALGALQEPIELACCLYPTAALVRADDLAQAFDLLAAHPDKSYALGVARFPVPVQRALRIAADGALEAFHPEHRDTRSQDLEPAYYDAGQFCLGRAQAWLDGVAAFSRATLPVVLPGSRVADIDTPDDWARAEFLFEMARAQEQARP